MLANLTTKYSTHPSAKYFKYLGLLLLIYTLYQLYIWSNTQSTDNAYIEADISLVSPEVNGVIKEVNISDNVKVIQGDIIAQINDEEYAAKFADVEAAYLAGVQDFKAIEQKIVIEKINLEKSKEGFDFATINYDLTSADYKRTNDLNKDKFASKKLLDNAQIAYEKTKFERYQASFNVQQAEQNLLLLNIQKASQEARLQSLLQQKILMNRNLANTKIKAPINGMIANSSLKVGNYVRAGVPIFAIVPEKLYIKANFKETQVEKFKPGMKAELKFDSASKQKIYGIIRNLSPATGSKFSLIPPDNATGNFTKIVQRVPVLIDIESEEISKINLIPGMSVQVKIRTDQ